MSISELLGMVSVTGSSYPKIVSVEELNQWLRDHGKNPYPLENASVQNPTDEHRQYAAIEEHLKRECGLGGEKW